MIRIIARHPDADEKYQLDVDENSAVRLNFQNVEPPEIQIRRSNYSGAFALPFSPRNNRFFSHYYAVSSVDGDFDPKKKTPVELYSDGILIFEGALRLLSVSVTTGVYQVSINALSKDIFLTLGASKLADLFGVIDGHDYYPTGQNYSDSQDVTNDISIGNVGAGKIMIPLADYGTHQGGRLVRDTDAGVGIQNPNYVSCLQMKPAIKLKHLLELISDSAGFEIADEGIWSSDELDRLYMMLATEADSLPTRSFPGFQVGQTADRNVTTSWANLEWNLESAQGSNTWFDPEDLITNEVLFTAPANLTGIFTASVELDYTNMITAGYNTVSQEINLRVLVNYATAYQINVFIPSGNNTFTPTYVKTALISNWFTLNAGDAMIVQIRRNGGFGPLPVIKASYDDPNSSFRSGYWTMQSYDNTVSSEPVSIKACMPDLTQADLFRDVLTRFNARIKTDPSDTTKLIIESVEESSGDLLDWTNKIDVDSNFLVKPPSSFRKRYLSLTDRQNDTWGSTYSRIELGVNLGEYAYDSQDEFASGEVKYESPFGAYQVARIPNLANDDSELVNVRVPQLYKVNDESTVEKTTFPPILMFLDDSTDNFGAVGGVGYYMDNVAIGTHAHFTPYFNFTPASGELTVWFYNQWQSGYSSAAFAGIGGWARNYWLQTINEIFSDNAKMIECGIYLTPADIQKFDFGDRIQIAGDRYKLIKIDGFNATEPGISRVTLLRVAQAASVNVLFPLGTDECNATPQELPDGTVAWISNEDEALVAESICCPEFGYTWDGENCYWTTARQSSSQGRSSNQIAVRSGWDFAMRGIDRAFENFQRPFVAGFPNAGNGLQYDMQRDSISLQSRVMRFSLSACTTGTTAETAERNDGDLGGIIIGPEQACRLEINAVGVYVTGKRAFGSVAYLQYVATVKNVAGTIEVVAESEENNQRDSSLGSPSIALVTGTKQNQSGGADTIQIQITGESDTTILWSCDVFASFISFAGFSQGDTLLIQESTAPLETENGTLLSTEE